MNKIKVCGLLSMSVLMSACSVFHEKTPIESMMEGLPKEMVILEVATYSVDLYPDITNTIKECNYFSLVKNERKQGKVVCAEAIDKKLNRELSDIKSNDIENYLSTTYGDTDNITSFIMPATNNKFYENQVSNEKSYVSSIVQKEPNNYEVKTAKYIDSTTYHIKPTLLKSDLINIEYIIDHYSGVKDGKPNTDKAIRTEGIKYLVNKKMNVLSVNETKNNKFVVRLITAHRND